MTTEVDGQTVVRDLVGHYPHARLVLDRYGIDYCCGGDKCLAEAANEHRLELSTLVSDLEGSLQTASADARRSDKDWYVLSLSELVDHIVEAHHGYLRGALQRLRSLVPKVLKGHGAHQGEVPRGVQELFEALDSELSSHLMKEEQVLFPYIVALERYGRQGKPCAPFGSVRNLIRQMEHEHKSAGEALGKLREVTSHYALPQDACPTFTALYEELQHMVRDLQEHIHLENNVLFPRAIEIEC